MLTAPCRGVLPRRTRFCAGILHFRVARTTHAGNIPHAPLVTVPLQSHTLARPLPLLALTAVHRAFPPQKAFPPQNNLQTPHTHTSHTHTCWQHSTCPAHYRAFTVTHTCAPTPAACFDSRSSRISPHKAFPPQNILQAPHTHTSHTLSENLRWVFREQMSIADDARHVRPFLFQNLLPCELRLLPGAY
jgi:hypothetical protein